MLARRIPGGKEPVALDSLDTLLPKVLEEDQARLLQESRERRIARTVDVTTIDEAAEAAATGWARIPWADLGPEGEAKLAEQGVSVRCLIAADGSVPAADDEPGTVAIVARAY
jgi:prolyl-tRNA synthetase